MPVISSRITDIFPPLAFVTILVTLLSAGQYFDVKIEYVDITAEEFAEKMNAYKTSLTEKFQKGHELEKTILSLIGGARLSE